MCSTSFGIARTIMCSLGTSLQEVLRIPSSRCRDQCLGLITGAASSAPSFRTPLQESYSNVQRPLLRDTASSSCASPRAMPCLTSPCAICLPAHAMFSPHLRAIGSIVTVAMPSLPAQTAPQSASSNLRRHRQATRLCSKFYSSAAIAIASRAPSTRSHTARRRG